MIKKLTRSLMWLYLLTKRLVKKPVFLITLLLIPVLAFAMSVFAEEESSVVRVALYMNDDDAMAETIIQSLLNQESVVQFKKYDDRASAIDAVKKGQADSAWGMSADFTQRVKAYADNMRHREPLVEISEQEENVTLRLAREQLYSALIPILSKEIYHSYLADELGYDVESNKAMVDQRYEDAKPSDQLIRFTFVDGETTLASIRYLSTPLRGIIAVVMVICGMAAAMVFLQEKENGIYSYLNGRKQLPVLIASCFSALVICSVVALVAMWLSGNFTDFGKEVGIMVLYVLMCTLFCTLMAQICRKTSVLAVSLPIVVVVLLVFCPVFLNHKIGMPLQYFLPAYYYLNAINADRFIPMMILFTVVCIVLCVIAEEISQFCWRHSRKHD